MRDLEQFNFKVGMIEKGCAPHFDFSGYRSVFLIAGRARPTDEERMKELRFVSDMMSLQRPPATLVYVSSLAVEREPTPYAQTKMACEKLVLSRDFGRVVRPPVIFGPGQDPYSDMLLPSIARAMAGRKPLVLKQPLRPFSIMHVDDVVRGMSMLGREQIYTGYVTKILNLRSNLVTPLDIIKMVSPGLPFQALDGWDDLLHQEQWPRPDGVHEFDWRVSPHSLRETANHHVKVLCSRDGT